MKNWNINKEKKLSLLKYLAFILLIALWLSMIIFTYPLFNESELIRYFLFISFLTLNCVVIAYFILLLGRKTEQEKALTGQYQEHYMVIKNKINISLLNVKSKKTSIFDVLTILLEAQISHKNISVLIPNPEEFAQEVIDAYGIRSYGMLEVVGGLLWIFLFLFYWYFVTWLPEFFFPDRTSVN